MPNRLLHGTVLRRHPYIRESRKTGLSRLHAHAMWMIGTMAACLPMPVHAQSSQVGGQVALASQLVDRGLAITPATPVLEGSVSWTSSTGWSLGLAGGIETRSPGHLVMGLARGSYSWKLSGDWQARADLLYYDYAADNRTYAADRAETGLYFTYRDVLTIGLSAMRVIGTGNDQLFGAADVGVRWPMTQHVSLSASAGIAQTSVPSHGYGGYHHYGYRRDSTRLYGYGQLGLAWDREPWHLEIDRVASSLATRQTWGTTASSRWVATISLSF